MMITRVALLVASFLFASNAFAIVADLRVTVSGAPETALPGATFDWTTTVTNAGPDAANVRFAAGTGGDFCVPEQTLAMAAGETRTFQCRTTLPTLRPAYEHWVSASAFAENNVEPNYDDNVAQSRIRLITAPDLAVSGFTDGLAKPRLPAAFTVVYGNQAWTAAENVTITIDAPNTLGFVNLPAECTSTGTRAVCNVGTLENTREGGPKRLALTVIAPDASSQDVLLHVRIDASNGDDDLANNLVTLRMFTYATTYVTNTNDSGEGSLRAALSAANASCTTGISCLIAFRIPGNAAVKTIRLASPLPAITGANITIDATTQTGHMGDSNPAGPEVELHGGGAGPSHGFDVTRLCGNAVRGFAINGFTGVGVYMHGPRCNFGSGGAIEHNYIGTDATGQTAVPNVRGIVIDGPKEDAGTVIANNVISGNTRAGVFVQSGRAVVVTRNSIGLDATKSKPLGNGASGVYFAADADGGDVTQNHIGFNAHAGVAVGRGATWVSVTENSIQANGGLAIDFGLDGPDADRVPVITSAVWDPAAQKTIVEFTSPTHGTVDVYASDAPDPSGFGEAQYSLGRSQEARRLEIDADLRGKWVALTQTQIMFTTFWIGPYWNTQTTELSRAVQVQ